MRSRSGTDPCFRKELALRVSIAMTGMQPVVATFYALTSFGERYSPWSYQREPIQIAPTGVVVDLSSFQGLLAFGLVRIHSGKLVG